MGINRFLLALWILAGDQCSERHCHLVVHGGKEISAVPEPTTMGLVGLGLVALFGFFARRK